MRIEPDENTLFPIEKDIETDSFRIRIALWPAFIFIFLLGMTLVSFQIVRADTFIILRFLLYPIIYILWGIFLLMSFISTFSYFTTRISAYPQKIVGRGVFIIARRFEIEKDQITSVTVKQSPLGTRMQYGTLTIQMKTGRVRIPWVEKPLNAKDALDALYQLK